MTVQVCIDANHDDLTVQQFPRAQGKLRQDFPKTDVRRSGNPTGIGSVRKFDRFTATSHMVISSVLVTQCRMEASTREGTAA